MQNRSRKLEEPEKEEFNRAISDKLDNGNFIN